LATWALAWLERQEQNFGKLPIIYASTSYVLAHLQNSRLARYPLVLANWTFSPSARPACPAPWSHYTFLQYTDRATSIPGIPGAVDADIFLGGGNSTMGIPAGWHEETVNGQIRLVAPNGHYAVLGFREWVLNHNWDAINQPLEEEWHASPLELSHPSLGAGQKQGFNQTTLEWTPTMGTFEAWQGQEIIALRAEIAKLQAQLPAPSQPVPNVTNANAASDAVSSEVVARIAPAHEDLN
jgi:glycosyl hydrolase family 25